MNELHFLFNILYNRIMETSSRQQLSIVYNYFIMSLITHYSIKCGKTTNTSLQFSNICICILFCQIVNRNKRGIGYFKKIKLVQSIKSNAKCSKAQSLPLNLPDITRDIFIDTFCILTKYLLVRILPLTH